MSFCVLQKRPHSALSRTSSASITARSKKKHTDDDVLYKIAIITADKKDAGTDAKVRVIHQCNTKFNLPSNRPHPILMMRVWVKTGKNKLYTIIFRLISNNMLTHLFTYFSHRFFSQWKDSGVKFLKQDLQKRQDQWERTARWLSDSPKAAHICSRFVDQKLEILNLLSLR